MASHDLSSCAVRSLLALTSLALGTWSCSANPSSDGFEAENGGETGETSEPTGGTPSGTGSEPIRWRVFPTSPYAGGPIVNECAADGSCPNGAACVRLAEELAICDTPVAEATRCGDSEPGVPEDECCDSTECGAGQICRSLENTVSGPAYFYNACADAPCESETDCANAGVCRPSSFVLAPGERCIVPSCERDSDCTAEPGGRCSLVLRPPFQSGEIRVQGICCMYSSDEASSVVFARCRE